MMKNRFVALVLVIDIFMSSGSSHANSIDDSLNKAKAEGKSVMLELGSVGCKPCEQMKPVMEKLRTSSAGKLEVIFIDIKKDRAAAEQFDVFGIPTQVFLDKNGKEFHRHYGFYAYEEIAPALKKAGL
jgi:thioredoxin 1